MDIILYGSLHGAAKRYAEHLAEEKDTASTL